MAMNCKLSMSMSHLSGLGEFPWDLETLSISALLLICNYCCISKNRQKGCGQVVCALGGYLSIVRLLSKELILNHNERYESFKELESPTLAQ